MINNKGFSLVELLIVIGIIGILSAIAGLAYKSWTDRYNVERQMKEMYSDLMKARVDAMSRGRVFCVTFAPTGYTITEDRTPSPDGNGECTDEGTGSIVAQKSFSANYGISWTGNTTKKINTRGFFPSVNDGGTIYVTTAYGAAYDCVAIDGIGIRINIGTSNGTATCTHK